MRNKASQDGIEVWQSLTTKERENLSLFLNGDIDKPVEIHEFTCADCGQVKSCPFAFDAYNTDGDCIAEK